MSLEEVIENHLAALGGRRAVEGVDRIRIAFHIVEPEFEVDGVYTAERAGRMRVDIFAEGVRVFSEGYDNGHGWQLAQNAEAGVPTSPEGTQALAHGIDNHLFGLHELRARGHRLELADPGPADGIEFIVLKQVYPDGKTIRKYMNPANWRIERTRERKALHPDVEPAETSVETLYTDFRTVGGVLRPFHEVTTDLETGRTLQTTAVQQVEINPAFAPGHFDRP